MLGHPENPPLLATTSVAVTMRAVRAISRKGPNDARSQGRAKSYWLVLGGIRGRRRKLQRFLSAAARLSSAVEGFSLFQRVPTRRGDSREVQAAPRLRDHETATRRSLVLRSEQPHGDPRERHPVLRPLPLPL